MRSRDMVEEAMALGVAKARQHCPKYWAGLTCSCRQYNGSDRFAYGYRATF